MNRVIKLAVHRPISCITFLLALTVLFFFGMKNLKVEPSTDSLMPKDVDVYRYNMRMKKVFGDSKLYMLSLIEAPEGDLFTYKRFVQMNELIQEIEEFHTFDYDAENRRMEILTDLGSVRYSEPEPEPEPETEPETETGEGAYSGEGDGMQISDEDLDALLTGEAELVNDYFDVFAIDEPLPDDMYVNALRGRRVYSLEEYRPVSLLELENALDHGGYRQLKTVLARIGLSDIDSSYSLSLEEYGQLLHEFESAYLYKSMEAVKTFMNPITGEDIIGSRDALTPTDFIEEDDAGRLMIPETPEEFEAYKKRLSANPVYEDTVYTRADTGEISALALNVQFQVLEDADYLRNYFMEVFRKHSDEGLEFTPVGVPVLEYFIQDYMKRDMKSFMPLVFLVVIITFLLNFRLFRGVLLPTLSIIMSIIWTMGLMGYLGIPLTLVVNILPTILVAVGSSYSIHILNQYLHDLDSIRSGGKKRALVRSMSHISVTVLLAALTTFIGFSTLGFNQVVSLKHFGLFSAVGTLFTMAISSLLIPSVLSLSKLPRSRKGKEKGDGLLQKSLLGMGRFTVKRSGSILILTLMALAFCAFGITRLRVESSPTDSFKQDSYVVRSDWKVSQSLKGSLPVNLMIDTGREGGVKDPEFLKKLDELSKWVKSEENRENYHLLSAFSFSDIIKRMHKAMNEEDSQYYTVPDDPVAIEDYLMLYSGEDRDSDGLPDTMERFTDPQYRVANLFIKTGYYNGEPHSTVRLLRAVDHLEKHLRSDPYFSNFHCQIAGQTLNFAVLNKLIARGQIITILLTLLIIAVVIYILFRDIRAALVSLIPISCSIITVFGVMGYFGIPLDITKCIIASITIGIGIDDTIHMLKTIRYYLMRGFCLKDALMESYGEAGKAIVYTSLALVCGFSVLMFSEFKVLYFLGLLVAMNMITTTVAALVVLPAAVWILKLDFKLQEASSENGKMTTDCA